MRIYKAQLENPLPGDWVNMINKDKLLLNMLMINNDKYDNEISALSKAQFKLLIKSKIKCAAFEQLRMLQETHTQISNIVYMLEMQSYLKSNMKSEHKELLFSLFNHQKYQM